MQPTSLSHSDQIVATLAKLPVTTFGTAYTKEVALFLARHMNKAQGWSACLYMRTIAKGVGCTVRTVRNALRRLEESQILETEHRKHAQVDNWNLASVYKLGAAVRSLCERSFRTPSKRRPAKSFDFSKQRQSNKDLFHQKNHGYKSANATEQNKAALAEIKSRMLIISQNERICLGSIPVDVNPFFPRGC
ncbi:helix-turn-helix domain-containing protein [Aeromonas hydrophila]